MHHCLSKIELQKVTDHKLANIEFHDHSIKILLEKAENWEISLGFLTYFYSMIIEKKLNDGEGIVDLIDKFYLLENSLYVIIQEFDNNFVDHLIRNIREKELTLEDELIRLQTNLAEYNYDKSLRF